MPDAPATSPPDGAEEPDHLAARTRLGLAVGAAVALLVSWLVAVGGLAAGEEAAFEAVNGLPGWVSSALWPVVQLGSILLLPAIALVAVLLADGRAGARVAAAGISAWVLAELGKAIVDRGRPAAILDGVHLHGDVSSGPGFPSGHTAVAAAVAVAVAPLLPARWRPLLVLLPLLVGLGRMTSGAHLPLDVVAGASIGAITGVAVDAIVSRMGRTT